MALHVGPIGDPDKYELVEVRSRGGEGEVWKGVLRVDSVEVPVAIKLILPSNEGEIDAWKERWGRQAELLRSLKHPGLVTVREVFMGPGPHREGEANPATSTLCLVMNWVEGPTLVEWVSRDPERHALESMQVIGGLSSAVDYLHSGVATGQPILHRDIKPANVILAESGPQLVDFGFVRAEQSGTALTMVGTPAYIAPEVASGLDYSAASDRYALGATAFFALTGEAPTISHLEGMHQRLNAVKGLEGRVDLHDHILSMLNRDPARRPTSAVDWAQSLAAMSVVGGLTQVSQRPSQPVPAAEPVPTKTENRQSLRKYGIWAGVAAAVAVVAIILASAFGGSGSEADVAEPDTSTSSAGELPGTSAAPSAEAIASTTVVSAAIIPPVVGLSETEAVAALASAGVMNLTVEAVGDPAPAGTVLSVEPPSGSEVDPDGSVLLTVAAAQVATIADVVGQTTAEAVEALAALGMHNVATERAKSVMPTDSVVQVLPSPGTEVPVDTQILLTVADPLETPNFLVSTVVVATAEAEALGATVKIEEIYDRTIDAGVLFGQIPEPGAQMTETLVLHVGKAPGELLLEDLGSVTGGKFGQGEIGGDQYIHALLMADRYSSTRFAEFNLSKDFDNLQATVGYEDNAPSGGKSRIEIFVDGTLVYTGDYSLGVVNEIDIDVAGALRLAFQFTDLVDRTNGQVVLGQITLLGDPAVVSQYYEQ